MFVFREITLNEFSNAKQAKASISKLWCGALIYHGKPMVLWTQLWYNGQNYGTIPKTMELRFMKGKSMVDYQKL